MRSNVRVTGSCNRQVRDGSWASGRDIAAAAIAPDPGRPTVPITAAGPSMVRTRDLGRTADRPPQQARDVRRPGNGSVHKPDTSATPDGRRAETSAGAAAPSDTAPGCGEVVGRFFQAFNRRDLSAMAECIAPECTHSDLAYPEPYQGKHNVIAFYKEFIASIPEDLTFHIEDITADQPGSRTAGVIWQTRVGGVDLPGGSGVSFYRTNGRGEIVYVRESPEHFIKLTGVALPALHLASPLIQAAQPLVAQMQQAGGAADAGPRLLQSASQPLASLMESVSEAAGSQLQGIIPEWVQQTASAAAPQQAPAITIGSSGVTADGQPYTVIAAPPMTGSGRHGGSAAASAGGGGSASDDEGEVYSMTRDVAGSEIAMRPLARREAAAAAPRVEAASDSEDDAATSTSPRHDTAYAGQLAGIWQKVKDRSDSDSYGRALDLMGVGGIQKTAALMIEGMQIEHDDDEFAVFYLTVVPYFKVKELYKFDIEVGQSRRDLRSGKQLSIARQEGPEVVVDISWGSPHAGEAHEVYSIDSDGLLNVESTVTVNGESVTTLQVYARSDVGAGMDQRYFAQKQDLPFGIDANKISGGFYEKMMTRS